MSKGILIIEDDVALGNMLLKFLERKGWKPVLVTLAKNVKSALEKDRFDIILSDYQLPDGDGINLIKTYRQYQPETPVIIMTSYNDVRLAVKALKEGAVDYITKPILPDEMIALIDNYSSAAPETVTASLPRKEKQAIAAETGYIAGTTAGMTELENQLKLVAPTNYSILVLGESGTGKEWVARKIHQLSNRSAMPFVAVDCGAINNELANSEFFGHIKGAYTGALNDKAGIFEIANGGTVFLDEIGNLSYENQIKLLRVLQERTVRRLGSEKEVPVDVRVIAATNEDLHAASETPKFREDLYHRINEFSLTIPPLRERGKDMDIYIEHFTAIAGADLGKEAMQFSEEALKMLRQYAWPGNLRELKNIIKKCVLLAPSHTVEASQLPIEIRLSTFPDNPKSTGGKGLLKKQSMEAERRQIIGILEKCHYNKSEAARILGIDRKTLYNKLKSLGLDDIIDNTLS